MLINTSMKFRIKNKFRYGIPKVSEKHIISIFRHYNPKKLHQHFHRHENFISHKYFIIWTLKLGQTIS